MAATDLILRAEAVALFVGGTVAYLALGGHALWLIPLLLAPDLSMIGYLGGPRLGAVTYNAVHNLVLAVALLLAGWYLVGGLVAQVGAVLIAHVGMDRALGYGLKLPTEFRDTHLGRIGKAA
ncbi:MAG TPA: DUF4260 domain-containing protein [Candidatus Limnocylindria bacterium]|jgi:hypothetical protein